MAEWSSYRALDLKSGDYEYRSRSDHLLDLSHIVPNATPRLHFYMVFQLNASRNS